MARKRSAKPRTAFSQRLEETRLAYGKLTRGADDYPQEDFAIVLGLHPETYRRYERSETEPNLSTLAKIHSITGQSLDYLVAGDQRDSRSRPVLRITSSKR